MELLATLTDPDTTLVITAVADGVRVTAARNDGVSPPQVLLDCVYPCLGEAVKACLVFFVGEWESVFRKPQLAAKLVEAISAQ